MVSMYMRHILILGGRAKHAVKRHLYTVA
jgi:hypothetical protein